MKHHRPQTHSDQTSCSHCGKIWDTNDPCPPPCEPVEKQQLVNFKIQIRTKGFGGPGDYTFCDTSSGWEFIVNAQTLREAKAFARQAYRDFTGSRYGSLEITDGPHL